MCWCGKVQQGGEYDDHRFHCNIFIVPSAIFSTATVEKSTPSKEGPPPVAKTETPKKTVDKKMEKFGTQTEKGKVITAFRNGDKHHQGVKITIHPTKLKTYDQVSVQFIQY